MNKIEKQNIEVPNLNIESFGVYWKENGWNTPEHFDKYYVTSLNFKVNKIFSHYNKLVYIPILFTEYDNQDISDIFSHFDDMYFVLRFHYGYSGIHYSDLYHISNLIDLDKIWRKTYKESDPDTNTVNGWGMSLIISYKGYDIVLNTQHPHHGYVDDACIPTERLNDLFSINGNHDNLTWIKNNYNLYPYKASYSIKNQNDNTYNSIYNVTSFSKMIEYIDKLENEENARAKKINSMYSKKTFKLIEN